MCFKGSAPESTALLQSPHSTTYAVKFPPKPETTEALELLEYESLPDFLKHNEFICRHYRSEWPLRQTILSIFSFHNETLNIWTHLLGFFIFLQLIRSGNSSNISAAFPRWPIYMYLAGVMFCLLMSSACHLLSCHSPKASYIMLRLDFAGISGLIVCSFYPALYYAFACRPFFRCLYLVSITASGIATAAVSLIPAFDTPRLRPARAALFACLASSGVVPIAHKMVAFGGRPEAVLTTLYESLMGGFYGVGALVYAARVPERWTPGRFDLVGHSHQLFHVLVVAGAYVHFLSSMVYLSWRETEGC